MSKCEGRWWEGKWQPVPGGRKTLREGGNWEGAFGTKASLVQRSQDLKGPKYHIIKVNAFSNNENYSLFVGREYQVFLLCFQIHYLIRSSKQPHEAHKKKMLVPI